MICSLVGLIGHSPSVLRPITLSICIKIWNIEIKSCVIVSEKSCPRRKSSPQYTKKLNAPALYEKRRIFADEMTNRLENEQLSNSQRKIPIKNFVKRPDHHSQEKLTWCKSGFIWSMEAVGQSRNSPTMSKPPGNIRRTWNIPLHYLHLKNVGHINIFILDILDWVWGAEFWSVQFFHMVHSKKPELKNKSVAGKYYTYQKLLVVIPV